MFRGFVLAMIFTFASLICRAQAGSDMPESALIIAEMQQYQKSGTFAHQVITVPNARAGMMTRVVLATAIFPTAVFALANNTTIHKPTNVNTPTLVTATFASTIGLKTIRLAGGYAGVTSNLPKGTKKATLTLDFYAGYMPAGSYTYTASVTDTAGTQAITTLTLNLVP